MRLQGLLERNAALLGGLRSVQWGSPERQVESSILVRSSSVVV